MNILVIMIIVASVFFACYLTQKDTIKEKYGDLSNSEISKEVLYSSFFISVAVATAIMSTLVLMATTLFTKAPIMVACYMVIIAGFLALCYWWHKTGEGWLEMLPFIILAGMLLVLALKTTWAINNEIVMAILYKLSQVLFIGTIGFFVADKFYFRYKELEKGSIWPTFAIAALTITIAVACVAKADDIINIGENTVANKLITVTTNTEADTKDDEFSQKEINHLKNREDSDFSAKLDRDEKSGIPRAEASRQRILEDCKTNAEFLAKEAKRLGFKGVPDYKALATEDGSSLSPKGKELYYKVEGLYETADAVREEAPKDGYNSGYNSGVGYVAASSAGITGNRAATKFTFKNGTVIWKMDRCGNTVTKNPSKNTPTGETDDPDPPKPPKKRTPKKDPADDPVNKGNAQKGGGQNKKTDGSGKYQPKDPRTQKPTGTKNNNNQGHSDPKTVKPSTPKSPSNKGGVVRENKMDYQPDPVTNRGPVNNSKPPTKSEGDGEFTPED